MSSRSHLEHSEARQERAHIHVLERCLAVCSSIEPPGFLLPIQGINSKARRHAVRETGRYCSGDLPLSPPALDWVQFCVQFWVQLVVLERVVSEAHFECSACFQKTVYQSKVDKVIQVLMQLAAQLHVQILNFRTSNRAQIYRFIMYSRESLRLNP